MLSATTTIIGKCIKNTVAKKQEATLWKTGGIYLVGQALQKVNETTKKIKASEHNCY